MNPLWIILSVIGIACGLLIANHDAGQVFGIESDKFASLVWLSVIGVVAGAVVLPRRGQWRNAARNAAVWLVLILLLMTGYLYRAELQDVGSRLTAGIVPGTAVSIRNGDGGRDVLLIRAGNGHFSARGEVNGAAIRLVVDTGASMVVLTERDARAAGIDTARLVYSAPISTANGRTTAAPINLKSVRVGDIERTDVPAMVARSQALETSLLGMSFLSTLSRFEFSGDRLVLSD